MKAQKSRRDRLFKHSKPNVRPAVYSDIRWMWAAAKRAGFDGEPTEFSANVEPLLAQADKVFILEDSNKEFAKGQGPVGVVLSNYDDWALVPHVEWFEWATPRNKLRCTVGFLQSMRYTRGVGSIKIFVLDEHSDWFKRLRRYIPIIMVGKIPNGREEGNEWIFYIRGRRNEPKESIRRVKARIDIDTDHNFQAASGIA